LKVLIVCVGGFVCFCSKLNQSNLFAVFLKKLLSEFGTVFPHLLDWITRHGSAVVNYEAEVLLDLLIGCLLFEELGALLKFDVHHNLVLICDLVLKRARKLVISVQL
jgi:hypothetical protein